MKKIVSLGVFFLSILGISYFLFITGQNHTLIINNKFKEKKISKNIVLDIEGYKSKKIRKNKKGIMDIKGSNKEFTLKIGEKEYKGKLSFNINRGGELNIENIVKGKNYLKEIDQY